MKSIPVWMTAEFPVRKLSALHGLTTEQWDALHTLCQDAADAAVAVYDKPDARDSDVHQARGRRQVLAVMLNLHREVAARVEALRAEGQVDLD